MHLAPPSTAADDSLHSISSRPQSDVDPPRKLHLVEGDHFNTVYPLAGIVTFAYVAVTVHNSHVLHEW